VTAIGVLGYNRAVPEHRITVHPSKPLDVLNTDLIIEVHSDHEKLGELRVSKGSLDWVPRGHRQVLRLEWERFDSVMRERGRPT
jgi:hypothetical protein